MICWTATFRNGPTACGASMSVTDERKSPMPWPKGGRLGYVSPWTSTEASVLLAERLAAEAPGDLNTVFYSTGGSSAVDTALRFVQFYNNMKGRPDKKIFIAREKGYHGSTYLAASGSGKERDRKFLDTNTEFVRFLPNVNPYIRPDGMTIEDWRDAKLADLENMILETGPDKVAAFIAEPILASGGVIVPPPGYHKGCLDICRKYDVLYISDEVVTGFGRLGHIFASEKVFGITPDIITSAKGLTSGYVPMGATIISDRLINEISSDENGDILFSNGYTYSGHPVSSAAAVKNLEILDRENLLDHVREVSPIFRKGFRRWVKNTALSAMQEAWAYWAVLKVPPPRACQRKSVLRLIMNLVIAWMLPPKNVASGAATDQYVRVLAAIGHQS